MTLVAVLAAWAVLLQTVELWQIRGAVRRVWGYFPSWLLVLQGACALALPFCPGLAAVLLVTTVLIAWRFRGTFNGGSDYMTVVVLTSLLLPFGKTYLAVQLCLSYFVAGVSKAGRREWWDGTAVRRFVGLPAWAGWGVIAWELAFPFSPRLLCLVGLGFHLANCRLLGLNRFLWIWVAAYPSLF